MMRALRWGLGLLLGLVLLGLAVVAVYVLRSMPQYDGQVQVAGLHGPVRIDRDAAGVVHIRATHARDAAFALGYSHAQDRGWQLEFNRRLMHGELAEILGEAALPTDRLMRTLGIVRAAEQQWATYPADVKEMIQAYSEGIQSYHRQRTQALSPEFVLLKTEPGGQGGQPWSAVDSVAWGLMMALDLGGNWGNEFARLAAAQQLDTEHLWQLYRPYPGEKPATSVDVARLYRQLQVYAKTSPVAHAERASAAVALLGLDEPGQVEGKGSNNWAMAGSRTVSGKPLLANDPHLSLSAPAIWYFAHLQAPQLNTIGATLPGMPMVVIGRNERVAWGFTNTGPDVQDLYLEQINPANPQEYKTPEGWARFSTWEETIRIKGKPDEVLRLRSTRHGPVISDVQPTHREVLDVSRYVLALRWSALEPSNHTLVAGVRGANAQDVPSMLAAYADYHSPMQNVVVADVEGAIAYKAIGRVPLRRADNDLRGLVPAPGWDARYDWAGWLPYAQTPSDNGTKGWVATANQRITAPGYAHFIGQDWTAPHRYDRIVEMIEATPKHDMASMARMHRDVLSHSSQRLLPVFKAATSRHALAPQVAKLIQGFEGAMQADAGAPLVFAVWADELTRGLVAPKLGDALFQAQYGKRNFRVFLEDAMTGQGAWWCAPLSCAEQANAALDRAIERIVSLQGQQPANWRWGKAHVALSSHKPFSQVPVLGALFEVQTPSSGDPFTVNVGNYWANEKRMPFANRHAASLRVVYDLSNLENSQFIYQTGQSGSVFDPAYRDMAQEWAQGQYRPLQLNSRSIQHTLRLQP